MAPARPADPLDRAPPEDGQAPGLDEDDQHDPIAALNSWVKIWHVDFVGRLKLRPRIPATAAFERSGLNASAQHDLGEHRCEQDKQVED